MGNKPQKYWISSLQFLEMIKLMVFMNCLYRFRKKLKLHLQQLEIIKTHLFTALFWKLPATSAFNSVSDYAANFDFLNFFLFSTTAAREMAEVNKKVNKWFGGTIKKHNHATFINYFSQLEWFTEIYWDLLTK